MGAYRAGVVVQARSGKVAAQKLLRISGLLLALMARLIRVESMVCSLSILTMKHMAGDKVDEYRALARWLGAIRSRIVETSVESHSE